ncbi:MAG: TadE/TadG family type IV pilus assembly protein [Candidatus Dormibacteraceae bacterium]
MSRGQTLLEFAIAWPLALALIFGCVQLGVWSAEAQAAREAALAGVRVGTGATAGPDEAAGVAVAALRPWLVGAAVGRWCPGGAAPPPVWICARSRGASIEVAIGGQVPALVPLVPGGGLPLRADAVMAKEAFR